MVVSVSLVNSHPQAEILKVRVSRSSLHAELKDTEAMGNEKGELAYFCICCHAGGKEANAGAGQVLVTLGHKTWTPCLEGTWEQRHKRRKSW